jgi:anthranilate 1,2-dioxygenase ferredoxin subunit
MREVALGLENEMNALPKEIKIGRDYYYLVKEDDTYRLISRMCPHAGALVDAEDGEFVCFLHGWSFDARTGACLNVPGKRLEAYSVILRDGSLVAELPG